MLAMYCAPLLTMSCLSHADCSVGFMCCLCMDSIGNAAPICGGKCIFAICMLSICHVCYSHLYFCRSLLVKR